MPTFANENPNGEVAPPLAQKRILTTCVKSIRIVMNQTFKEIRGLFIRHLGFHLPYSFQGFRILLCNHSSIALQRYENSFEYANKCRALFVKLS